MNGQGRLCINNDTRVASAGQRSSQGGVDRGKLVSPSSQPTHAPGKERARPSSGRLPRFSLEMLETRVLLFASPLQQSAALITLNPAQPPAALAQLVPGSSLPPEDFGITDSGSEGGEAGAALTVPVGVSGLLEAHALLVDRLSFADVSLPGFSVSAGTSVPSEGALSGPLLVTMASESQPPAGGIYQSAWGGVATATAHASATGAGVSGVRPLAVLAAQNSSGEGGATGTEIVVPAGRFADVEGSISPGQSPDILIPLAPGTVGYRLTLRAEGDLDPAQQPVMDEMSLDGPSGTTLQQYTPPTGPGMPLQQSMYVSLHDVPADDHLVVQVTTAGALETAAAPTTVTSAAPSSSVSFVLSVQRQQTPDSPSENLVAGPKSDRAQHGRVFVVRARCGFICSGGVIGWSGRRSRGIRAGSRHDRFGGHQSGDPIRSPRSRQFPRSHRPARLTHLGPPRADPRRCGRRPGAAGRPLRAALSQDIPGLEQDDGPVSLVLADDLAGVAQARNAAGDAAESEGDEDGDVSVSPGRALREPESAHQSGRRAGLTGLLAALPAESASAGTMAGDQEFDRRAAGRQTALASEALSSPDRDGRPDYLKAAYGLVLGLGLTAGPLFPDLLASGRLRVPRWLRYLRSRPHRTSGPIRTSRQRLASIGAWLGGRFARRGEPR